MAAVGGPKTSRWFICIGTGTTSHMHSNQDSNGVRRTCPPLMELERRLYFCYDRLAYSYSYDTVLGTTTAREQGMVPSTVPYCNG